jgi:acetate kinase
VQPSYPVAMGTRRVLVFNCGSTSLKHALVAVEDGAARRLEGATHEVAPGASHAEVALGVLEHLSAEGVQFEAIAHRIVHGAGRLDAPVRLSPAVLDQLEDASRLAPLHNRPALEVARALLARLEDRVPQFASFDTAFHARMPERASRYAIPLELADRHGLRRYGFHGIAHEWMARRAAAILGRPLEELRLVTLQLGGGASAAAIEGGRSLDTSMGLTPLEGLMMATRSGSVDPALPSLLAAAKGCTVDEALRILNEESGLLGVSGQSSDVRVLLEAEANGDTRAALALEMFCYRVRREIAASLATLEGADAIVFGGGIGEHQPELRRRICAGLEWAGIALDDSANEEANAAARGDEAAIGRPGARVAVLVVRVDEESLIASDAARLLAGEPPEGVVPSLTEGNRS